MDLDARRHMWECLKKNKKNKIILMSTHYMDEAERCSSVGYIYNSKLIVSGGPDELKRLRAVVGEGVSRYELVCRPLVSSFNKVKAFPYVQDVTIFGQALHVTMPNTIPKDQLLLDLRQAEIEARGVREIEPSLEDVFVTLTHLNQADENFSI